jgi:SAM-dependent methyltransferase
MHLIYIFIHWILHKSLNINPLFRKYYFGKKILKGHISEEHLQNPDLDMKILRELRQRGIRCKKMTIDPSGYHAYLENTSYPDHYYGGGKKKHLNFTQKSLEHYVSTLFIDFFPDMTFVDIAACNSPFSKIVQNTYKLEKSYRQDLIFKKGIHGDQIGGYASELPFEKNSIDAVTLHCSLEHFEKDSDTEFFAAMDTLLKPGGKILVVPFYIAREYSIHVDPVYNLLKGHQIYPDDKRAVLRYCSWRQYFSRHYDIKALQERIINAAGSLVAEIVYFTNHKEIHPDSYLRFALILTKKTPAFTE